MQRPHRHDDLELNLVLRGRLDYLFGGSRLSISAGQIAIFWAATPHRLIAARPPQEESDNCWVHIPLTTVLGWGLSAGDLSDLLGRGPIVVDDSAVGRDVTSMFESWLVDLPASDTAPFAMLEAQALVRRLLHHDQRAPRETTAVGVAERSGDAMRHVVRMAQFAVTHFRESITPSDIARQTHLNPTYAMTLFRENVGITVGGYLTKCRIAEAQRLLVTTTKTAAEIAHAAGFGSQSSFYTHFTRACGCSPSAYRQRLR
jgi:AraC-like DNA-binding protein